MKVLSNPKNKKCNDFSWCLRTMLLTAFLFFVAVFTAFTQTKSKKIVVPDWALPASPTHKQVPPPSDFHRATITYKKRIGIFEGQSDVGAALVPGSSSYNPKTKEYTISSAGYNIWYNRDEFRYLWKKMSGDVSLAADIKFTDKEGINDRKTVLIIRQSLDDDSKEVMVTLHGAGLIHIASRYEKGQFVKAKRLQQLGAQRLGIEKRGDVYSLLLSKSDEPLQQTGDTIHLQFNEPFYVGIGFSSHQPDVVKTSVISNVVLENAAGKVR